MNPPSVYELTKPRSHSTSRITNIVQSIRLFLSLGRTYLRTSHSRCAYRDSRFLTCLQSDTQIPVVRLEQTAGRLVIALSQLGYDPHGAIAQFCARSVQVDHEIAAHFTETNHCTRADHIERDLRSGPAFNLVDPARISGPTGSAITKSLIVAGVGDPGWPASAPAATDGLHVSKITFAPSDLARASAPRTKGVRPLAVIPITTSAGFTPRSTTASAPVLCSSSAPSTLRCSAVIPPAITPCTKSVGAPNVGGISLASRTPMRPLLPAPM